MNNYLEIIKNIYFIVAKEHSSLSLATNTDLPNLPSINSLPNDFWSAQLILLRIKDQLYEIAKNENLLFNSRANVTEHEEKVNPHPQYLIQSEGDTLYDSLNSAVNAITNHESESDPHPQYSIDQQNHAQTHAVGGSDPISPVDIGAVDSQVVNASIVLGNEWTEYNSTTFPLNIKKQGNVVFIRGLAGRTTSTVSSTTVLLLPEGFRPSSRQIFSCLGYFSNAYEQFRVDVYANGPVAIIFPQLNLPIDWLSLGQIHFIVS